MISRIEKTACRLHMIYKEERLMQADILITNIGQLLPMDKQGPVKGSAMNDITILEDAAIAITDSHVTWVGPRDKATQIEANHIIDAGGKLVTPGLVEPHTHLVFGGSREEEMALKQQGVPYLDILERGGGILSTVRSTQEASYDTLLERALFHLDRKIGRASCRERVWTT